MKFSKSWVMEWVRTELSDNALAEQITMAGLEVDAVEAVAASSTMWSWVKWSSAPSTRTPTSCG